jgi:RNA polymerase sigma-70 factor (ECF subfamily)
VTIRNKNLKNHFIEANTETYIMPKLRLVRSTENNPVDIDKNQEDKITADFKEIYYQYHEQILRFIWLRVNSLELAQDLVQEVFLRVWRTRHKLNPKKSIKSYIYTISNNLVIDYLRKKRLENSYLSELKLQHNNTVNNTIELSTSIKFAINNLPEKLKTVFLLGRYQGLQYAEIAEICHVSYKTVVVRMSKAIAMLRKELS